MAQVYNVITLSQRVSLCMCEAGPEPSKLRNYCKEYGERLCEDGEKLMLMEANDNHEEERI